MRRTWVSPLFFLLVAIAYPAFTALSPPPTSGEDSLTANLDLPFDAAGEDQEEEDAPEIVVFFGQSYEASAVVFALDSSGSMTANRRWEIQTREIIKSIRELTDKAEFSVVFYSSGVSPMSPSPLVATPSNKARAINFVQNRSPAGDTCLGEGVIKALEIVGKSQSKYRSVIVTSDGLPDVCATGTLATAAERKQILQRTMAANPDRSIRVHTIWVGAQSEAEAVQFMRSLADAHGGSYRQVLR